MWRTNTNTIEGERARTASQLFFRRGCATMRRRLAEISSSGKSMWNSITAQEQEACRDFVPMLGQSTRTAIYFGAPGARQGQVLFDARLGRSHRRLLPAQGRNARMQQRYRCRPGAQSEETGTMGQLYYPAAFFSYPAIMYFTAGVAGVFTALHHMWKASCKQGKKKCGFMVCCRECPVWWGTLLKS